MKTLTIELTNKQFLSDVASQLPKTAGIHLIILPTGGGKTNHAMAATHNKNAVTVFPVKAIKEQQEDENKRKQRNCKLIQIEKLPLINSENPVIINLDSLHNDEGQILYQGGFRLYVENLINYIIEVSKRSPVYLYSAAVRLELMPVKIDTVVFVKKPFKRNLNLVQIPTSADIKGCPVWVSTAVSEIIKHVDEVEPDLPVLLFVNSKKQGRTVREHLVKLGCNHDEIMLFDSHNTSLNSNNKPNDPETRSVYESILKNERLGGWGKRIFITTDVLAEGININDRIIVISCQAEASKLFQQQGRARVFAYHWLICGDGTDTLHISDDIVYRTTRVDGEIKRYPIKDDSKITVNTCNWSNPDYKLKADLYSTLATHYQRGCYGVQVVKELSGFGYTISDTWQLSDVVKRRVSGIEISKSELLKFIAEYDCPTYVDRRSALYKALSDKYEPELFDQPLSKACDWLFHHDCMKEQGFRLDCWDIYSRVNALGRDWLKWAFSTGDTLSETITDVDEFRELVQSQIDRSKTDVKAEGKKARGGRIKSDVVEQLSSVFWSEAMPVETEYQWHTDSNKHMRLTLFKLLMGFEVDADNHWSLPDDKPSWYVPLTNAEGNKYRVRLKHINNAGFEIESFCLATGHTNKSIAGLKTKDLKSLIVEQSQSITF